MKKYEVEFEKEGLENIVKKTFPMKAKMIAHIIAIVLLVMAIVKRNNVIVSLIYIAGAIIMEWELYYSIRKSAKISYERIFETTHSDSICFCYTFEENGIQIHNKTTGGESELYYDAIHRYVEIDNYVVLVTKSRQFIALHEGDVNKEEMMRFLKSKNAAIKMR